MSAADFRIIRPIEVDASILTSSDIAEPDAGETAWATSTGYVVGDIRIRTATHRKYRCLVAHTSPASTPTPENDTTKWEDIGGTNKYAMFDATYQTQSTRADSLSFVLTPGELVNAAAFLNLEGSSVRLEQSITGYDRTISLVKHEVLSWYDFFFELPLREGDAIFADIPPSPASTLTATIENAGGDAACGVCVIGRARTLGTTQWEPTRTINDYSRAEESTDGSVSLSRRSFSKRLNIDFRVQPGFESVVTRLLEEQRATPLVFIGSEDYSMTIIYGFLGAWSVPISITGRTASLEIKGLT
jgi:hypothetical protein